MGIDVNIIGSNGQGARTPVTITRSGELVTAPLHYSETQFRELNLTGTAFSFFQPKSGQQFVITGFSFKANRSVSNTVDARVVLYEASSVDSIVEDLVLFEDAMVRGERTGYTNTNIIVSQGKWINATTTDASVFITVLGYYINKLD